MGEHIIEQSLILDTGEGSVVITGCSHQGVVAVLHKTREVVDRPICTVFGGFHLLRHSEAQVGRIVGEFKEMAVAHPGPTHCTGDDAIRRFRGAFGDRCLRLGVGRVLRLAKRAAPGTGSEEESNGRHAGVPPQRRGGR
jgi:7,8-dihydropterin-6-yl-methyl-4-(beta-D-ribofuranosyl)aminobenzene 5'-phosphate synthase